MTSPLPDLELKKLLANWKLEQHYAHFLEQKITIKVLKILRAHHIEKLFAQLPVGDQAIFEHCLDIWKRASTYDDEFASNMILTDTVASLASPASAKKRKLSIDHEDENSLLIHSALDTIDCDDVTESHVNEKNTTVIIPQIVRVAPQTPRTVPATPRSVVNTTETSPVIARHVHKSASNVTTTTTTTSVTKPTTATRQTREATMPILTTSFRQRIPPFRYDLMKIVNETSGGQLILNYYSKHQHLREEHRTALINVIARYIDANGCTLSLSESNQLEQQIVEIFPTEKAEFYRTARRGRIYNKIANMKRIYNKFSKETEELGATAQVPSRSSSSLSIKEEDEYGNVYTEHNIDDWRAKAHNTGNLQEFWKRSQALRLKQINEIETLQEILTRWPEYKDGNIAEWVAMDFAAKFPNATKLSKVFHDNIGKLEKLLFTKVSTSSASFKHLQLYKQCSTESQHLIIFYALHQLFPPKHHMVMENGIKCKKRHSIQDSQNSCICIQSTQAEIDHFLDKKVTATPPMLLVVGELGGEIEDISVYFEGIFYPVLTVVEAVQLCCELFFLFNIDFPEESVIFYHFMQTFFLNIHPEVKNSRIYTTINDINAY